MSFFVNFIIHYSSKNLFYFSYCKLFAIYCNKKEIFKMYKDGGDHMLYSPNLSIDSSTISGITEVCEAECSENGCEFVFDF